MDIRRRNTSCILQTGKNKPVATEYVTRITFNSEEENGIDKQRSIKMTEQDKEELTGQIIDIFEDFLTEKILIPKAAIFIKGDDYDDIAHDIRCTLENWGVLNG